MQSVYGARMSRINAFAIDAAIVYFGQVSGSVFGGFLASLLAMPGAEVTRQGFALGWAFWGSAVFVLNTVALQGLTGHSIGKRVMGLRVIGADGKPIGVGRACLRAVMQLVSAAPFYLGYAVSFFDERRRTWHDIVADTLVIKHDVSYPSQHAIGATVPEPRRPFVPQVVQSTAHEQEEDSKRAA